MEVYYKRYRLTLGEVLDWQKHFRRRFTLSEAQFTGKVPLGEANLKGNDFWRLFRRISNWKPHFEGWIIFWISKGCKSSSIIMWIPPSLIVSALFHNIFQRCVGSGDQSEPGTGWPTQLWCFSWLSYVQCPTFLPRRLPCKTSSSYFYSGCNVLHPCCS